MLGASRLAPARIVIGRLLPALLAHASLLDRDRIGQTGIRKSRSVWMDAVGSFRVDIPSFFALRDFAPAIVSAVERFDINAIGV
jgi:hypothetical protein